MKRIILTAAILLMTAVTASCTGSFTIPENLPVIPESAPQTEEKPESADEQKAEAAEKAEEVSVPEIQLPEDRDVLAEFEEAYIMYGEFNGLGGMIMSDYEDKRVIDGVTYYRCTVNGKPEIDSKSEFMNYLGTLFGDSVIADIIYMSEYSGMKNCCYIANTENGFYSLLGQFARGGSVEFAGVEKREVIKESDTKLVVRISAKYYTDEYFTGEVSEDEAEYTYEVFEYPYENINGEWKFTAFEMYY